MVITVTRTNRNTGAVTEQIANEKESNVSVDGTPAVVAVTASRTWKLADYESLRIEVGLTIPCAPEDVSSVFKELVQKLPTRVTRAFDHFCESTGITVED